MSSRALGEPWERLHQIACPHCDELPRLKASDRLHGSRAASSLTGMLNAFFHIRQLHRDLLKYSGKDEHHRGQYKANSNSVAAFNEDGKQIGIVFETATPFDTPRLMAELVAFINEAFETKKIHPLLIVGVFVVVFLEIHPLLHQQMRRLAKKVEREKIVLSALPELSVQILEYTREHGRVTIGDFTKLTGVNRNTLKKHFSHLVEKGQLVLNGKGRGAWYVLA